MKNILLILFVVLLFPSAVNAGWLSNIFGSSYSYNVLFYTPSGEEIYLGTTDTVSNCQRMAGHEANRKSMPMNYICCKTDGKSFCLSKHK